MNSVNDLKMPTEYRRFLNILLTAMQGDDRIDQILLFGSCAKGSVHPNSDIDIAVITKVQLTMKEEMSFYDYLSHIAPKDYIPCDMLVMSRKQFDEHKESSFYVQKYIHAEGVELREPLRAGI